MNWQDLFRENRWQKLFALGLSVLIWFTVRSPERLTEKLGLLDDEVDGTWTFTNVPILVLTAATGLERYQVTPVTVRVDLRGDRQKLRDLPSTSIQVYVHLADSTTTPQTLEIQVNPPPGTTVVTIEPTWARVERLSEPPQLLNSDP